MWKKDVSYLGVSSKRSKFSTVRKIDCLNRPYETDADVSEIDPFATYKIREINVKKVTPRGEAEPIFPT